MTEIDGVARRMLLCPPDLNPDHVQTLIEDAEIDAIVTDQPPRWADAGVYLVMAARAPVRGGRKAKNRTRDRMADADVGHVGRAEDRRPYAGRTDRRDRRRRCRARRGRRSGRPSMTSAAMAAFRFSCAPSSAAVRWCCRNPARRSPIMSRGCTQHGVTHISGTPSHWRKLLMSGSGLRLFAALCPPVRRDRRPGRARWLEPDVSGGLDRPCLCVDRGRRRLCRRRRPRGLSRRDRRARIATASR